MGFVFAGALVGVLLDRPGDEVQERRLHARMGGLSLLFASVCFAGSYLPSVYADSQFWTSAPSFFLLRVGIVTAVLSAAYYWEQWRWLPGTPRTGPSGNPLALFGRASLFVYWVHVELVYGFFSRPLHRRLSFPSAILAFAAFSLLMFGLVLLKNRLVAHWKEWRRAQRDVPELAAG